MFTFQSEALPATINKDLLLHELEDAHVGQKVIDNVKKIHSKEIPMAKDIKQLNNMVRALGANADDIAKIDVVAAEKHGLH